jgi:hypothetical protein
MLGVNPASRPEHVEQPPPEESAYAYYFGVECLANSKEGLPLRLMFIMKARMKNPDSQEIYEVKVDRLTTIDYNDGEFHIEAPMQ